MLVIFYVDVISYPNFNLPHIYFLNEKIQISHMVSKHGLYYVK
jgi:hypothetical protein